MIRSGADEPAGSGKGTEANVVTGYHQRPFELGPKEPVLKREIVCHDDPVANEIHQLMEDCADGCCRFHLTLADAVNELRTMTIAVSREGEAGELAGQFSAAVESDSADLNDPAVTGADPGCFKIDADEFAFSVKHGSNLFDEHAPAKHLVPSSSDSSE